MPKVAGGPVKLDEGTRWAATFISKGSAYSFKTAVIGYTYRPAPLLFLEYPVEAEVSSLRLEKRYPVNIPAILRAIGGPENAVPAAGGEEAPRGEEALTRPEATEPVKALVVDLSEGGFMAACPTPLWPETAVEADFYLPQEVTINGIAATVKTCTGKKSGYFMGLSFIPPSRPEVAGQIEKYIRSIENMALRL
jgi:c-di-GMP-binding flagellar brake protein YcgR